MDETLPNVLLVPGGISPVRVTYAPLIGVIGESARITAKELEVYAGDSPPPGYSIEMEAEAIGLAADHAGFDRFNLIGFSGGGAASVIYTARHPDRVASLAVTEPAWIGNTGQSPEEKTWWAGADDLLDLSGDEFMRAFASAEMAPGVAPPPPSPGPLPWMRLRPAGMHAMMRAFKASDFDIEELRGYGPIYFATGALSSPRFHGILRRMSEVAGALTGEVYEARSHMDPPHRSEPERYAAALARLWTEA